MSIPTGAIYQPAGNSVSVEVTIPHLDKNQALGKAKELMETTIAVTKANSEQAQTWARHIEPVIDSMMEQKRKELLEFYK